MGSEASGPASAAQAPAASAYALLFIFITLLIDTIGLGIILPVMPELIRELTGEGLSQAAIYGGWLAFAYSFTQFLCGPIIGNLSDHFGRRPVLFGSLLAFGIDYIVMGSAPRLWWLFVGRVIAGMAGASFTTGMAYIADVTTAERRAQNFGLVGLAFGVGFIIGPSLGGILGSYGPRVPFFVSAGLALLNLTYGVFILPESLPPERRRPFSWGRANIIGIFLSLREYRIVLPLLGVLSFWALSHQALQSTWSYFTMLKFDWSERAVGYSLGGVGLAIAVAQGGLTRLLIPRWGERVSANVGMTCVVIANTLFATVPYPWMIYATMLIYSPGGLVMPSLQALMTRAVPRNAQGGLQGAIASTIGMSAVIGPPLMTGIFAYFTHPEGRVYFPGAPFLFAAILTLTALVVLNLTGRWHRNVDAPAQ